MAAFVISNLLVRAMAHRGAHGVEVVTVAVASSRLGLSRGAVSQELTVGCHHVTSSNVATTITPIKETA
jgi:hypothetical protein